MKAPPLAPDVDAAIAAYPPAARARFLGMREIVFAAAADTPETGPLTETLKWGEPAYLTEATKSGATLRIAWSPRDPGRIGIYLNCRSSLVEDIRTLYPGTFEIEGTRGLKLALNTPLPTEALDHVARLAQSYHRRKRSRQ